MGTWGTGVFDDDRAADVRAGFRELVAAGYSSEDATARLIAEGYLRELVPGELAADWIALAITQWKTGRLLDWVKDRALQCIRAESNAMWPAGRDWPKREKVLARAAEMLSSPQRSPVKIKPAPVERTPFQAGDVIRYRLASGSEVGIWVMRNRRDESLTTVSESSEFLVIGFGDPHLAPVENLLVAGPPSFVYPTGIRWVCQFHVLNAQAADLTRWEVIANVPFQSQHEWRGFKLLDLGGRGVDPNERSEAFFQWIFDKPREPAVGATLES